LTSADLLVIAPWLVFGAGVAAIGFGLLSRRTSRRRDPGRRARGRRAFRDRGKRR